MKTFTPSKVASLILGLLATGSALAADQYYMRVPAPAACSAAHCTVQPSVLPGSQAPGGQPPGQGTNPGTGTPTPTEPAGSPILSLSTTSLEFDALLRGYSSHAKQVVVSNTGTASLTITGISVVVGQEDFGQSNNCGGSLPVGGSCEVAVTFSPSKQGALQGTLAIATKDGLGVVGLTGTGHEVTGTLTPATSTDFGTGIVGTSNSLRFSFQNTGSLPITAYVEAPAGTTINSRLNTCGFSYSPRLIAAGGTCSTTIAYSRTAVGSLQAPLTVMSTEYGQLAQLGLTGRTEMPKGVISVAEVSFGPVISGTTSEVKEVTLRNQSTTASLAITGISTAYPGTFGQNNNCGTSLAPGAFCTITLNFTPSSQGTFGDYLGIVTEEKTTYVNLSGTGVRADYGKLDPFFLEFGDVPVYSSVTKEMTFTNQSDVLPLTVTEVTMPIGFTQTNNCNTLAPKASCIINVTFTPTGEYATNDAMYVKTAHYNYFSNLTGKGVPAVALSATSLSFDPTYSKVRNYKTVTVTNLRNDAVSLETSFAGTWKEWYSISNPCGNTLPAKGSCTLTIGFEMANASGIDFTRAVLVINAGQVTKNVQLSGVVFDPIEVTPISGSVNMPSLSNGQTATQTVTLKNVTSQSRELSVLLAPINNSLFVMNSNCGPTLAAGTSCTATVSYTANRSKEWSGQAFLKIKSGDYSRDILFTATTQ